LQRRAGTYLHPAHHASIVRMCSLFQPFFGQTGAILRWVRRQTSERLGMQRQEDLELALPAWMRDPLACCHGHEAPRLSVAALLALRNRRAPQPVLDAVPPATPWVSLSAGARDAQEASAAPTAAGSRALQPPHRVAPAAHRQAPAGSRTHGPTAPPRQPQCPEAGV
jgi:hypothetical protein